MLEKLQGDEMEMVQLAGVVLRRSSGEVGGGFNGERGGGALPWPRGEGEGWRE